MGSRKRNRRQLRAGCILASVLGIASGGAAATAQAALADSPPAQAISAESEDGLRAMAQIADVIFAGQVIAIRRHQTADGAVGVVEIDFSVSDAIRGVSVGMYTVREWGGLWASGYEPFHVGERYLMLLHAPGAAGLSSPVGGSDGAIPIRGDDRSRVAGLPAQANAAVVDLRWVATRAVHALSYKADPVGRPASLPFELRAHAADAGAVPLPLNGATQAEAPAEKGAAYTSVLTRLRSWESGDAAR